MSSNITGRHRAPSRLSVKPLARASAALIAAGGMAASMSVSAQAAPATPAPAQPVSLPSAPTTLPAAPVEIPSTLVAHPTTRSSWSTVRWGSRGTNVRKVQRVVGAYADGIFGPKTQAAVKRWQSRRGLVADGIVGPITSRAMGLRSSSSTRSDSSASRSSSRGSYSAGSVLSYAQAYTGIMYRWAGNTPAGFDCSGYIQYVFGKAGISLPRTAEQQRQATTRVSSPRPGDLVFWGAPAYHNAIYAGNGMIYDSGKAGLPSQKRRMFSGVTSFGRVG